jgi:hypothetical protein
VRAVAGCRKELGPASNQSPELPLIHEKKLSALLLSLNQSFGLTRIDFCGQESKVCFVLAHAFSEDTCLKQLVQAISGSVLPIELNLNISGHIDNIEVE